MEKGRGKKDNSAKKKRKTVKKLKDVESDLLFLTRQRCEGDEGDEGGGKGQQISAGVWRLCFSSVSG